VPAPCFRPSYALFTFYDPMAPVADPTIFCLTPIKNEAWILDRFLQCASTWADHIIVADQQSDDGSRAIARSYKKVTLIDNDTPAYDEAARQKLLIDAARALPCSGKRILLALDADEMLTANWMESEDWQVLQRQQPGTVLRFRWANVTPQIKEGWISDHWIPFGFVDDGSAHEGEKIHSPRIPVPSDAPTFDSEDIRVLHYQYANWERMKSKQRWYQCYEVLEHPEKRPVTIFRQYHHMDASVKGATGFPDTYFDGYEDRGIDMTKVAAKSHYYWDEELVHLFIDHGVDPFRKVNVWEKDWEVLRSHLGVNGRTIRDPRTRFERAVHRWLADTQKKHDTLPVRVLQKILQLVGW